MGISGLLPFLKKSSRPCHVRELSHSTVAVDVYCWLHKGAFGCAEKLVQNQPTNGYVIYVMKYVDLLLYHNIKPILVFDGRNLPSKAETEKKRRDNRQRYRALAVQYLREGRGKEAGECFRRCVDITPAMAREVIQACQERNVDCIVAPYEADAQLAFLNLSGIAQHVITEDSDLTLFGCENILFKMDSVGNGVLYEKSKLGLCLGNKADAFDFSKFRYMCILSGCDYLQSLPGIGLGKAFKFFSKVTNPVVEQVLPRLPSYLNMHQINVSQEYVRGFIQADRTFLYQLVFDPRERRLRPLNDYPENERLGDLSFAGAFVEDGIALQLALGNLELRDLGQVHNFDPDARPGVAGKSTPYGKRANHVSMWSKDFDPKRTVRLEDGSVSSSAELKEALKEKKDTVRTAFGDYKVWRKAESKNRSMPQVKKVDLPTFSSTPVKRKECENLSHVDISSEYCDDRGNEKKKQKISAQEFESPPIQEELRTSSPEKIYVSKYFNTKKTSIVKTTEVVDKTPVKISPFKASPSHKSAKKTRPVSASGSWFSQLDAEQSTEGKLIYRTDNLTETDCDSLTILPEAKENCVRKTNLPAMLSDASLSTPKPSDPCREALRTAESPAEKKLARNPFAKKSTAHENVSTSVSPTETARERVEEEDEPDPSSSPVFQSSFKAMSTTGSQRSEGEFPSSQLSGFSIESDSFKFTPKSSLEFSSSQSSQSQSQGASSQEGRVVKSFPTSSQSSTQSAYFKRVSSPPSAKSSLAKRRPKGASGMVRGTKQRSIADMFKKV